MVDNIDYQIDITNLTSSFHQETKNLQILFRDKFDKMLEDPEIRQKYFIENNLKLPFYNYNDIHTNSDIKLDVIKNEIPSE